MTIKELYEMAKRDGLENEELFVSIEYQEDYISGWNTYKITDYETIDNMVYLNHEFYE